MSDIDNRYLNLAGAPWSPQKPNARLTSFNYIAAAATSLTIFGAAQLTSATERNQLVQLFEILTGTAVALTMGSKSRQREAASLSAHHEQLVIDTQPDKTTPPTPSDILTRVHACGMHIKREST